MSELDLILFIIANTAWLIIAIAQAQIIKNQKEMESLNDDLINAQRKAIETYRKSISWNGAKSKYDIRRWNSDHTKMGKGITLTKAEAANLFLALQDELK